MNKTTSRTLFKFLLAFALSIQCNGCASAPVAKQSAAPVHEPVRTMADVIIHSEPEGAEIFVSGYNGWQSMGRAPVSFSLPLADGKVDGLIWARAIPTEPGQFVQTGLLGGPIWAPQQIVSG